MSVFKRIQSSVMFIVILLTSLFTTGELPKSVTMPEMPQGEYTQWVNPFIGTGGLPWVGAMLFPGATTPFGLVRLSPDTTNVGGIKLFRYANSGYHSAHNYTTGFSHTRLSGTGSSDLGNFRVTPAVSGRNPTERLKKPLAFSHEDEMATAGYYAVNLPSINCLAELTATTHTGVHRYTFSTSKNAHLFIDSTSIIFGGRAENGWVKIDSQTNEITGGCTLFTDFTGRYGGLTGYYVVKLSKPIESFATWNGEEVEENRAETTGNNVGADLNFGSIKGEPLVMCMGLSFVSLENARENLEAEVPELSFDKVRDSAVSTWNDWLSRIKITSDDADIKEIFYTALYHSMIMPTDFTDVNGEYLGFGKTIGKAEGYTYRTDMSLWDTFRTEHPLLCMIAPEVQRDCVVSLVEMAKTGGRLPRWPSGGGYTGSMFGSSADMVIAETYLKGITDFDVEAAYRYMKLDSDEPAPPKKDGRDGINEYNEYGYCPADLVNEETVSCTLEYAWADSSISLLARALGKDEEADRYYQKSQYYKNIFDPETKYFRAKNSDGSWVEPFNPRVTPYYDALLVVKMAEAYSEGSARQWRWSVPHDTKGLIELFGSDEYFVNELNDFMQDASLNRAAANPGSGYWQGNQHDIHAPYLFNNAGRPDLTQKWVRWSLENRHSTDTDGLDGNDDGGTLSAWYIFSALGFYPVAGSDKYWIGSPNINSAEINLGNGCTLRVIVNNQSTDNIYVQSVTLNGVHLSEPMISHSQLASGGTLEFTLGASPAENGGF